MSVQPTYYADSANWALIPDYMRAPLVDYVMMGTPPGSFLRALLSDAPISAVYSRADTNNQNAMSGWIKFIYNYTPSSCHGSETNMLAWIAKGGYNGN
jgi:hypothetical protein